MKLFLAMLLIVISIDRAYAQLPDKTPVCSDRSVLQYDDGTAEWGAPCYGYAGVWFCLQDFSPYAIEFYCDTLEFWTHHGMGVSWWDSEIWTGGSEGPGSQLVSVPTVGYSMQPAYASFDPPINCGDNFWVIMDCESGGQPIVFADGTPNPANHSFLSDDFETWEPFTPGSSSTAVDFFIRAHGTLQLDLEESSWGAIKALF